MSRKIGLSVSGKSAAHAPLTGSVRRRIVRGGSKRIGMPRGRIARPLLSVLKSKISKSTRVTDRLPFPLEFRNHNAVLENHSGGATRPRKNFDDIFSRLDTIPACVGQTASQPSFDSKDALCRASRSKTR